MCTAQVIMFLFFLHTFLFSPLSHSFDLIANGGASLTLHFERAPFLSQERTVWLPWNSFYAMDTLMMKTEENTIPGCDLSGFVRPDPVVVASPLSSFFSSRPGERPIIPETQVRTSSHKMLEFCQGYWIKDCFFSALVCQRLLLSQKLHCTSVN